MEIARLEIIWGGLDQATEGARAAAGRRVAAPTTEECESPQHGVPVPPPLQNPDAPSLLHLTSISSPPHRLPSISSQPCRHHLFSTPSPPSSSRAPERLPVASSIHVGAPPPNDSSPPPSTIHATKKKMLNNERQAIGDSIENNCEVTPHEDDK
ncbi:protein TRACHEARY ELEMENT DIFFERENTIATION-RELATED 7A-like [Salvia hispanica]|uniref:protein TRACHEARY ELEMENT DIFFERENTIATION-RELATED 7A-like n=1 Tax=Salvia hispanica TaxID=49212 RepID=UPI002009D0B0|nr:protein TRACHEARY ELEMENT DIFFERENTIATION-RELATED 7A-like [Salvia hispanica]